MFFLVDLEKAIMLPPRAFGPLLFQTIGQKLRQEVGAPFPTLILIYNNIIKFLSRRIWHHMCQFALNENPMLTSFMQVEGTTNSQYGYIVHVTKLLGDIEKASDLHA